jgi:hypothetical protein
MSITITCLRRPATSRAPCSPAVTGSRRKARNCCSSTCCRSSASGRAGSRRHDRVDQPRRAPVRYPRLRRPEGTRVRRPPEVVAGRMRWARLFAAGAATRRPAGRAAAAWSALYWPPARPRPNPQTGGDERGMWPAQVRGPRSIPRPPARRAGPGPALHELAAGGALRPGLDHLARGMGSPGTQSPSCELPRRQPFDRRRSVIRWSSKRATYGNACAGS